MKDLIKFYGVIALLFLYSTVKSQVDHRLKIISYNIWNGFEHTKAKSDKFVHWMERQQPDIVALEELVDFKQADLQQLAKSYGHLYSILLKEKGYPVGITSRYPITLIKAQVDEFWHGMLHVKIKDIDIIVTHLSLFPGSID
ncbi:endonuclease/exonuclease/phosphatase family protein [Sphingobacterium siyangense]|uniref:endonuclease/exonuclease/phosphatase family protein n=1 Tax=Sphingobacterium siyangense TaxID=459529 RepID=UPI003DA65AAF